jgi:DNA-binding NarL/FixJ family response regulator
MKKAAKTIEQPAVRRVFVVDDHPIIRNGLLQLISQERDLEMCGGAGTTNDALALIPKIKPDLVLVDVSLKAGNGLELTRELRAMDEDLGILVLSMHDELVCAERAIRAGANGYVMKAEPPETLLRAIRTVLRGDVYISDRIAHRMLRGFLRPDRRDPVKLSGVTSLTARQMQIFELIGAGVGTAEISQRLGISVKTLETHRCNMKRRLGVKKASDLLRLAVNWYVGNSAANRPIL